MATKVEITKKYGLASHHGASKKQKGQILDTVVSVTGWNREHASQQLCRRVAQPPGLAKATVAVIDRRKTRARKYSYDAIKMPQRIWAGRPRGRVELRRTSHHMPADLLKHDLSGALL